MKVYVAIWEDRHCDVTAHVFSDATQAIKWARQQAKAYDRHDDYHERKIADWLFYAEYSFEGDSLRVMEVELDRHVAEIR
jgi:hypothetical protein